MQTMQKETLVLRFLLASIFTLSIASPTIFQPFVDAVWGFLRSNALFKSSVFETIWTVFCYAAVEPFITYIFIQHPELRIDASKTSANYTANKNDQSSKHKRPKQPRGMKRPSRRLPEAIKYVAPLLFLDLVMIKKFAGVPVEDKLRSGNYDISSLQKTHSGHFLSPTLHNFSSTSPLQTTRALPLEAPSSRRVALELICSFILYDALFFAFHLSLHVVPGLKSWHAAHHKHQEIHPQITNQLSVFERLGLVLLANFSLNIIGSHVLTRTLFVPIFVWLLVEIHSGLDVWWSYDKVLPAGFGGGAKRHKLHHEFGFDGGGLEPFFCWCEHLYQQLLGHT